jgi:hypothetical protein
MNDTTRNDERIERIEEERLTTADLAGAGQEERAREEASKEAKEGKDNAETLRTQRFAEENPQLSGTPVEVRTGPREESRNVAVAGAAANAAMPVASGSNATPSATTASRGAAAGTATAMAREPEAGPLFSQEEARMLRARWDAIQVGFVDEPRRAVEEADSLVATAMKRLAEQFSEERSRLEGQWDRGGDVSTEDLRIALRRYRSFFGRLLTV